MMAMLGDFFVYMIMALTVENLLFTRGLGIGKTMMIVRKPTYLFSFTWVLSVVMVIVTCLSWGIYRLLRAVSFLYAFYPLIYLVCVSLLYLPLTLYYEKKKPEEYKHLKVVLRLACFNTAVIGASLIAMQEILTFSHALGFAVGSAVGFSAALLLVGEGQRVLSLQQVPRAFRGLPVTLLYIGILSLAFYGLIGHQLPV